MNFEEWLKEVSKGVVFPRGGQHPEFSERINSFFYEESDGEPKTPGSIQTSGKKSGSYRLVRGAKG